MVKDQVQISKRHLRICKITEAVPTKTSIFINILISSLSGDDPKTNNKDPRKTKQGGY